MLDLLIKADIALYINNVIEEKLNERTRVTWGRTSGTSGELFRGKFSTIDDYSSWLRSMEVSAILYDASILQISYDFIGKELIGHRLAYYPCPFDIDSDLLREEPFYDVFSLYNNNMTTVRLRTPLRFDFDIYAQRKGHPASHLTLNSSASRVAVFGPVSPGHFIQFIFSSFYQQLWNIHSFLRQWNTKMSWRTITQDEKTLLHIAVSHK